VFIEERGAIMTNEERIKKYLEEHCSNCKNKDTNLCDIRVSSLDCVTTRCEFYNKVEQNTIK
jgi:hypothetical protein